MLETNALEGLSIESNRGCYMQEKKKTPRLTLTIIKKVQTERN